MNLAVILVLLAADPAPSDHWAFRPPVRPPVPIVGDSGQVRNPVDAFIQAKLEAAGLSPAPEADRRTLARRLSFDLTGLPPSPLDVDAFLQDQRPDAYERFVDRLLASPHFGERWAQHWLDAIRYAETNGYELDADRPDAWRYRDYVVQSFNRDIGYDRFLTEQVAGDELAEGKSPRGNADLLIATGMNRCGPNHVVSGNLDKAVVRQENLTEIVNGISAAILGLTIGCARCHDHKFDPLPQQDFYRIQAFFAAAQFSEIDIEHPDAGRMRAEKTKQVNQRLAPLKKQIDEIEAPYRKKIREAKIAALPEATRQAFGKSQNERSKDEQKLVNDASPLIKVQWDDIVGALSQDDRIRRTELKEQLNRLEAERPAPPAKAWSIKNSSVSPQTRLLKRGDVMKPGEAVTAGYPGAITSGSHPAASRLDLARWLTRSDHPLTSRVMVNRVWHHLFGRGIVTTLSDFGVRGERPTHPELLDWLSMELVEKGWSIKNLVQMIVTSAAYRRASQPAPANDTDNQLLSRMNRKRLEAEAIRDATLFASGSLNPAIGGPSIRVPLESEVYDQIFTEGEPDNLWPITPDASQHVRRSIYLVAKRNVRQPLFEAFDQPDTLTPCIGRGASTSALQALILINGPFAREQSQRLAELVGTFPQAERIDILFLRTIGRFPNPEEKAIAEKFLASKGPLEDLALALFNANDFLFVR